ncbi:MAG TPA: DUF4256 domain-containing protein [Spirochaetaceae bacterium]|jgi:hypothetical protein|nr:DUF4256 domain-containing protein [Spirochaetaceae bacterium]
MDDISIPDSLKALESRFKANMGRHTGIRWEQALAKLSAHPQKLASLRDMEATGGEPDLIGFDEKTGEYLVCDCSAETPLGRRNICYDRAALDARKANKPKSDALSMAASMGIELLNEAQYRSLQELGEFDRKTSSWILTPADTRKLGGALFCDRRYNRVFTYHNGAESYYSVRGFRGLLRV